MPWARLVGCRGGEGYSRAGMPASLEAQWGGRGVSQLLAGPTPWPWPGECSGAPLEIPRVWGTPGREAHRLGGQVASPGGQGRSRIPRSWPGSWGWSCCPLKTWVAKHAPGVSLASGDGLDQAGHRAALTSAPRLPAVGAQRPPAAPEECSCAPSGEPQALLEVVPPPPSGGPSPPAP